MWGHDTYYTLCDEKPTPMSKRWFCPQSNPHVRCLPKGVESTFFNRSHSIRNGSSPNE